MAKKRVTKKVTAKRVPLHKRPVHELVGYSVLLMLSVVTLFLVMSLSGR